jgi:hypothetical protein
MVPTDDASVFAVNGVAFDGLYEYEHRRRALLLGRNPK